MEKEKNIIMKVNYYLGRIFKRKRPNGKVHEYDSENLKTEDEYLEGERKGKKIKY